MTTRAMLDRRVSGWWDRRAVLDTRHGVRRAGKLPSSGDASEVRPEQREDAAMRERFDPLWRSSDPTVQDHHCFNAGLRAMYRELKKEKP